MCGICGMAGSPDRARLEAMSATLEHRGPDASGEYVDGPVALASRRLSIIDLAGGDQPIFNEDGSCVVVQNGEIYNHPELMRELLHDGHTYRTHSDTETIVHLYEQHGLDFARRLRGMFAVAIWDQRTRRLVLARDRYGIKPLYYRAAGGTLEFASELRAAAARRDRPRRAGGVPRLQLHSRRRTRSSATCASCPPGTCSCGRRAATCASSATPIPAPRAGDRAARRRRGGARGGAARAHARLGASAPARRRSGRRAPLGRRRLLAPRGARRAGDLRGACTRSRSGSRSGASTSAPTRAASPSGTTRTTTSCSCIPTRRCCSRRSRTRSTSRSPTRPRCRRTSSPSSPPST